MQLDEIKIPWKAAQIIFNLIRKAININDPVKGEGILISKTETGSIISLEPKTSDDNTTKQDSPANGFWRTVIIVDPDSCVQSTIDVWSH